MNKNTGIIIGFVLVVLVIGGAYFLNDKNDSMVSDDNMQTEATGDDKMTAKEDVGMTEEVDVMMKAGSYEAYALEKVALASESHDVVLFFRASWCPTCRTVDSDIKANLSKIPESLAILDVDYDNSSELKKKYGVTYQHTFVQVDKDGNLIKKWSGSSSLSALVAQIQ